MKIYTRTGDTGMTSLVGGKRLRKDSVRIEAYGTVDELNSHIGNIMTLGATLLGIEEREVLADTLSRLFDAGAYLATDSTSMDDPEHVNGINDDTVRALEDSIDRMDAELPALRSFVMPAGHPAATAAHIARTVARRAERRILTLADEAPVAAVLIRYVNRLSDWLFTLARYINHSAGCPETPWVPAKA